MSRVSNFSKSCWISTQYTKFLAGQTTHKQFFLRVKTGYIRIFIRQIPGLWVKRES